jgi:hypothetical protein
VLPVEILREAVESYSPYLQASGEMHDPVFGEPTQYGTPYHAFCNAVLAKEIAGERKSAYADRAVRGLGAALGHVLDPGLPPTASGFDGATGAVGRPNHRDFFWPPILKTFLILRDLGVEGAEDFAGRISGVDIEASFAQRPPSNWAAVWLSGEWLRLREGLSPFSKESLDLWLDRFFEAHILTGQGIYQEPGHPNSYDLSDESALFPSKADVESGGTVHLPSAPGIGVRPDEEALRGHDRRGVMRLVHAVGEAVELRRGPDLLFRYVYESGVDPVESPKPYFHPLRTLAGEEVTLFRPHDHPWHTGLAMTSAYLSGENFWGGPTFVRDRGYIWLENQGRIKHQTWNEIQSYTSMIELLSWNSHQEETWIEEERGISVGEIETAGGFWSLDLSFLLKNVRDRPLIFGSPTTEGRPAAGYGGSSGGGRAPLAAGRYWPRTAWRDRK